MSSSSRLLSSQKIRSFVETKLWYALLAIPVLFIFGKVLTIPVAGFQYEITLTEIIIAAVSIICFVYLLSPQYRSKWRATPIGYALVLLFLLNLVSVLWVESYEKWVIAIRVLTYQYATFFIVANLLKTKRQCMIALAVLFVPAVVCGVYVIQAVSGVPYQELLKMNRAFLTTPVGALSLVAGMVALFIPVVLGLYQMTNRLIYRVIGSGVYIFLVAALLHAASKAAILSAFCGVICMLILIKQRRIVVIGLTACAIILFSTVTSMQPASVSAVEVGNIANVPTSSSVSTRSAVDVLLSRFANISSDPSTQFRLLELETAARIFRDSPWIGQGAGNLKVAYKHYTGFYDGEANNIIVQFAAEFGLLGLALFAFMVYQIVRLYTKEYLKHRRAKPFMTAIFTSFLVTVAINAAFEVTIVGLIYGILFWYVIGIFSAYSKTQS